MGASDVVKVLVADDHRDTVVTVASLLRDAGYEVETAADGPEVLRKVPQFAPDLVLLDIAMPHMDGNEVAKQIHKLGLPTPGPILIAYSGYGTRWDKLDCAEAGFDLHLTKPGSPELFDHLDVLLDETKSSRREHKLPSPCIELMQTRLEMANTLIDVAHLARNDETRERCLFKAMLSHDRVARRVRDLEGEAAPELVAALGALQRRLG